MNKIEKAISISINDCFRVKKGERVLIVYNNVDGLGDLALEAIKQLLKMGAYPEAICHSVKGHLEMDKLVSEAIWSKPDVIWGFNKSGWGRTRPEDQKKLYTSSGKKELTLYMAACNEFGSRAAWSACIDKDDFVRLMNINWADLRRKARSLGKKILKAKRIKVTAPGGTDFTADINGKSPMFDTGEFYRKGIYGNLPSGEVFVCPNPGTLTGTIVYDVSLVTPKRACILAQRHPLKVTAKNGFIEKVEGRYAKLLLAEWREEVKKIERQVAQKHLTDSQGREMAKNIYAFGEIGFGLNPNARSGKNTFEDEKVVDTAHVAIGSDYNGLINAPTHLDCVLSRPRVIFEYD